MNYLSILFIVLTFSVYPNNLKSWELGKEVPPNFCPERVTIADRQGTSEDRNLEGKPTKPKTNFSSCLGIYCDESKEYVSKHLSGWEGWCSEKKAYAMMDLIDQQAPQLCVEIGVFGGSSLFPTAVALKTQGFGVVYAIDAWDNSACVKNMEKEHPSYEWWSTVNLNYIYKKFLLMLKAYQLNDICIIIRATSENAAEQVPDGIDILHLDGNYDSTLQDVLLYFPKVKKGGHIWLSNIEWTDVYGQYTKTKAIKFLKYRCLLLQELDDALLFRKK